MVSILRRAIAVLALAVGIGVAAGAAPAVAATTTHHQTAATHHVQTTGHGAGKSFAQTEDWWF